MSTESSAPLDAQQRADGLYAFVGSIFPNFTPKLALQIVQQVSAHWLEPPKGLARTVRTALADFGYKISHVSALQAASRIQGHSDYFHTPKPPLLLKVLDFTGVGALTSVVSWRECSGLISDACDCWLQRHPTCAVISLECRSTGLSVFGVRSSTGEGAQRADCDLIAFAGPNGSRPWLTPAMGAAVEAIRRRVEEAQSRAIVDGVAAIVYCHGRAHSLPVDRHSHDPDPRDASNAELVLMRQDDELDAGFEIARGDELACWAQLELALEKSGPLDAVAIDDLGVWIINSMRFAWEVAILRNEAGVPQLLRGNLPSEQSHRLLRRYKALKRLVASSLRPAPRAKRIEALYDLPSHCQLDVQRVQRALNERGETWETFCERISPVPLDVAAPIELGVFMNLAIELKHPNPDDLLARPRREQLHVALDDHLLRALIPRVDHVRYRVPSALHPESKSAIKEIVDSLATSIALRLGMFPMERTLPDAVYSADGEELISTILDLGLDLYVGLMPHFIRVPESLDAGPLPEHVSPYAIGTSLFLHIEIPAEIRSLRSAG